MKKLIIILLTVALLTATTSCSSNTSGDDASQTTDASKNNQTHEETHTSGKSQIGNIITMGEYEQDNNLNNGKEKIEWRVLDEKDGRLLLLSVYCLDIAVYNDKECDVTWENCSLRTYLNDVFINTVFSDTEKERIIKTELANANNSEFNTNGGNNTTDSVFLLSLDQVNQYLSGKESKAAEASEYAKENGALLSPTNGFSWWLLRSPGAIPSGVAFIMGNTISTRGVYVNSEGYGIRPAMWITAE